MSKFTDTEIDTLELPKEEEKKEETQEKILLNQMIKILLNWSVIKI